MSFQQVSPHGSLHEITCFFATDTGILSSDDEWAVGFRERAPL